MNGEIVKKSSRIRLTLERKLHLRDNVLQLDRNLCVGCGICAEVCPKNAITQMPASVASGKLVRKPTVDFDASKCIMCGICATICPLNAITSTINGEPTAQFVKQEVFPLLLTDITIRKEKCSPECNLACQDSCPRKAIKVVTEKTAEGGSIRITDVQVDKQLCVYCKMCEAACPLDAIRVQKPFQGTVEVIQKLCAKDCQACIDICPTQSIKRDEEGKLEFLDQSCIYCSTCEKVCPNEAIKVSRNTVAHADVKSGIWLTALEKLASYQTVSKELAIRAKETRRSMIRDRY